MEVHVPLLVKDDQERNVLHIAIDEQQRDFIQ